METTPVLPEAFFELVVDPEESIPQALVKLAIRLPVLLYRMWRWAFTATGEATPELRRWICEGCEAVEAASETTTQTE